MIKSTCERVLTTTLVLTFVFSACALPLHAAETDQEKSLRELANEARQKAAESRKATLRTIVSRQKGDQLKVYLKGTHGAYVNGKSVNSQMLVTLLKETDLDQAIVTPGPGVAERRVDEIRELLTKNGAKKVNIGVAKSPVSSEEIVRLVISRQKGNQLKVYMNSRGTYINGRQLSSAQVTKIASETGLSEAIITTEHNVVSRRVDQVEALLKDSGIKKVSINVHPKPAQDASTAKLKEIITRQKGNQLKVYLKNATRIYVNGKSVTLKELTKIITETGLNDVSISADAIVTAKRITEIKDFVNKTIDAADVKQK